MGPFVLAFALAACGGADGTSPDPVVPPPKPAAVASVSLDSAFTIETHTTKQLTAVALDSAGAALSGREITFVSTDTAVATVSATGLVRAVASGTATIYANSEGKAASALVTVVPMPGTVVIRVVTTDSKWGQEAFPGWPDASPVKDTTAYSLYDVEIGRGATTAPEYLSLYKFKGYGTAAKTPAYFAASRLFTTPIAPTSSWEARSQEVLAGFKLLIDQIMERERPTRIVVEYSGHGSATSFFEGALTFPDAREFLKYVRHTDPTVPLILDFSTNCDVGYFDFVVNLYDVADYLFAGEREYGGYDAIGADINDYLSTLHDRQLHRFWQKGNDLQAAFDLVTSNRKQFWQVMKEGLLAVKKEESLAVYDLAKFPALMDALATDPGFDPLGLSPYEHDIGTYVKRTNHAALTEAFRAFQLQYVSTRDIVQPWTRDTWGFSVDSSDALAAYLAGR